MNTESCIELRNIRLRYGNVQALHNVNLIVQKGEIRAMVGEHGAGKSSIARILGGYLEPDSGSLLFMGKKHDFHGSTIAGVEVVHQTVKLMPNLSVAENMFISNEKDFKSFFSKRKKINSFANTYLEDCNTSLKGEYMVSDLKRSDWVLIDILRKLYKKPSLLILDEAIEQLSNKNVNIVIELLKKEVSSGMSVIYITHRIDDVYTFADTVSIVKNGDVFYTDSIKNIDKINLIKIAYTQLMDNNLNFYNEEFFHLLKYNEAILRNLPVSLIVINKSEEIKIINESAKNLLKLDTKYNDENISTIFIKAENIMAILKESFKEQTIQYFYYLPFKRSDSQEILLNITKVPIFDEHFLIGNILLFHDITEQEILREEFELREKLAATGLLAAGVAHEINNPLGMILNDIHYIQVVSKDEKVRTRIQNLEKHFGYITDVISNLLSFSAQAKQSDEIIDINATIQEMKHLLAFYVEAMGIQIEHTHEQDILPVHIPSNEFKQILLNLIKNSIEAFSDSGNIHISTSIKSSDGNKIVLVQYTDDGPGISQERINDIFLPFNSTKKTLGSNLGIGLSVTHNIVRKYGGTIRAETPEEKGCRFVITFPYADITKQPT